MINLNPRNISKILIAFALSGGISLSTLAYDAQDKEIINQKLDEIVQAGKESDFSQIFEMMPPKILLFLAESGGISTEELKMMMSEMMNAFLEDVSEIEYTAYLDDAKVYQSSSNRDYLVIPTSMSMLMNGKAENTKGNLLAIEENGEWYIMRIDEQSHIDIVKTVYPDIINLELIN